MDSQIAEEILEALVPTFENMEAQSAAILQFLKDKQIANEEELKPYLEQAANASSVRWRAVRVRMERLLTAAEKHTEKKPDTQVAAKDSSQAAGEHVETGASKDSSAAQQKPGAEETRNHKAAGNPKSDGRPIAKNDNAKPDDRNDETRKPETSPTGQSQNKKIGPTPVAHPTSSAQPESETNQRSVASEPAKKRA